MKKYLLPLAIMSALLVSCEKPEPEYEISISPTELIFGAEGGEQTVKITSTYGEEGASWWMNAEADYDWCEPLTSSGVNGEEITFIVKPRNQTYNEQATFTFYCGDKETSFYIIQEKQVYSVSVEPTELTFDAQGGEANVTITSSDDWEISNKPDWIDVSERYGENGAIITVATEYCDEADSRSGEIVFTCGDKEAKISVTQKADDSPIIQFKDPKFLEAVLHNADKNGDGQISEKEAMSVTTLDIHDDGVRNIDEIKYFTALTTLWCYNNQLTSLDVSKNTALTDLSCSNNQLTSLDVSKNQLTSLDVSKNTALTELNCSGNQLTSLDVSNNTALTELSCRYNQLTSLDVSNNTALETLYCSGNQLTSLDLYNNRLIESLWCRNNPLQKLILYKYHIINDSDMEDIESEYGNIIEYVE